MGVTYAGGARLQVLQAPGLCNAPHHLPALVVLVVMLLLLLFSTAAWGISILSCCGNLAMATAMGRAAAAWRIEGCDVSEHQLPVPVS